MIADKALANSTYHWNVGSGDTSKGRVEHRSFSQLVHSHCGNGL